MVFVRLRHNGATSMTEFQFSIVPTGSLPLDIAADIFDDDEKVSIAADATEADIESLFAAIRKPIQPCAAAFEIPLLRFYDSESLA